MNYMHFYHAKRTAFMKHDKLKNNLLEKNNKNILISVFLKTLNILRRYQSAIYSYFKKER